MKPLIAFIALLGITYSTPSIPAEVIDVQQSTVQVLFRTFGKLTAICTGAVVNLPGGPRVVTAGHCIQENSQNWMYGVRDYRGTVWPVAIEAHELDWPRADYAILRTGATSVLPALELADSPMQIGDPVYSWSSPLGIYPVLFAGYYAGETHYPDLPDEEKESGGLDLVVMNGDGGASGSALLNEKGEFLGVVVGGFSPEIKLDGMLAIPLPPKLAGVSL